MFSYRGANKNLKPEDITEDLFEESTLFFKYSDFAKWLEERGLISS